RQPSPPARGAAGGPRGGGGRRGRVAGAGGGDPDRVVRGLLRGIDRRWLGRRAPRRPRRPGGARLAGEPPSRLEPFPSTSLPPGFRSARPRLRRPPRELQVPQRLRGSGAPFGTSGGAGGALPRAWAQGAPAVGPAASPRRGGGRIGVRDIRRQGGAYRQGGSR